MARFILTPQAQRELLNLWRYIDPNSGEARANSVLRRINRKIEALAQHPGIGRSRDELAEGLRSLPANPYLIFISPSRTV